ncbi:MAG: DUF1318 domain-containing protein [Opitutae bacterium]
MKTRLCSLLFLLSVLVLPALAQTAGELRARMAQRLAVIDDLKTKALIGENNRGYLEVRGPGAVDPGPVVTAENRDREAAYAIIARETGSTPAAVGQTRAKQIAANSRGGVWIQDEGGAWKRK